MNQRGRNWSQQAAVGAAVALCLWGALAVPQARAANDAPVSRAEFEALKHEVDRERDARAIQNLMGRRSHLQLLGRQDLIFDLYSKKQPDISWGFNFGYQVGQDTLRKFFHIGDTSAEQRNLDQLIKTYPQIENKPENYAVGSYGVHALLSPIIEVAEDGKTAKGFWHTFGPMINMRDGEPIGRMAWEKYGVDFIKEDGQWRLWHVMVYTDFTIDMGQSVADKLAAAANTPPPPAGAPRPGDTSTSPAPYSEWSPTRVPINVPLPVPYKTFSETFSYGAPGASKP